MEPLDGVDKSPIWAALKVAGFTGLAGLAVGGTVGVLRSPTPVLWATISGAQWALLGGTYWGMRSALLDTQKPEDIAPQTRTYASALSGGLTFAVVGAVTRGRKNVIPGAFMGTLFGLAGQSIYNVMDARNTKSLSDPVKEPIWRRAMRSDWSPVKALTDEEYSKILREKLLRIEADMAIIDDDIAKLREEQKREAKESASINDEL